MKTMLLLLLGFTMLGTSHAQIKTPVQWAFSAKKLSAAAYEVHLTATLDDEWHIYSQTTPEGGPTPTAVSFSKNPLLTYNGAVKEQGQLEEHFEQLFGVKVKQYAGKVIFMQTVSVKAGVRTTVTGTIQYMICNDHECIPPTQQKFTIALN